MRNLLKALTILLIVLSFGACGDRQGRRITDLIPKANSKPDSVLAVLNTIDQTRLSDKDLALYSLVYTLAQDKKRIDVDNDSLLRYAYNWYRDKPTDSLYARCEYYMGKYYHLNDSSEKALACFANSIRAAKKQRDYYTLSMSLERSSVVVRDYDPDLALRYSRNSIDAYNRVKDGLKVNKVYLLLNLAESYFYKDNQSPECISLTKKALCLAMRLNDSLAIADSYQDLSVFYAFIEKKDSALFAAKKRFAFCRNNNLSALAALGQAYYQADSLPQAKAQALAIRKLSKTKLAYDAFDILYVIAMSKGDLEQANAYKDSIAETFQAEIRSNSQAKNKYYNSLIQKDRLRAKYQNENRMKNLTIVALSVLFILIVCFILYASRLKRKQLREHNEEEQRRRDLIIEHQKTQMTTMRDFLVRKINILHKLDAIQTADSNHVVLNDEDWDELQAFLNSSDNNFVERLQKAFPDLTKKDIRFLMLIRIRLPFSTIASVYNIEPKSVKQKLFLIKKKLGLSNSQMSAKEFIESY